MASASATALFWRPLPLRPCLHSPTAMAGKSVRICLGLSAPAAIPVKTFGVRSSHGCSSRFSNWSSLSSPFVDVRLEFPTSDLKWRSTKNGCGVGKIRAGMNLDPGGGGNKEGGVGRVIVNLAIAGSLTYLTVSGQLGWLFDTLVSLWLLAIVIPIVGFGAFLFFAERQIVKGACPNCGQAFQVFEFTVDPKQTNLCPYCSQPFKLDADKNFVRDGPQFSNERFGEGQEPFGGFGGFGGIRMGSSSPKDDDSGGVIVDVEAEVVDKD